MSRSASTDVECSQVQVEVGSASRRIYNWIYRGWITARHAPRTRNWIITADDEQMRQLRERRARPPGYYSRTHGHSLNNNPLRNRCGTRNTAMRNQRAL